MPEEVPSPLDDRFSEIAHAYRKAPPSVATAEARRREVSLEHGSRELSGSRSHPLSPPPPQRDAVAGQVRARQIGVVGCIPTHIAAGAQMMALADATKVQLLLAQSSSPVQATPFAWSGSTMARLSNATNGGLSRMRARTVPRSSRDTRSIQRESVLRTGDTRRHSGRLRARRQAAVAPPGASETDVVRHAAAVIWVRANAFTY